MMYGQIYLSLGWGHLEVRLQIAFVQVKVNSKIAYPSDKVYISSVGQLSLRRVLSISVIEHRVHLSIFKIAKTFIRPMHLSLHLLKLHVR